LRDYPEGQKGTHRKGGRGKTARGRGARIIQGIFSKGGKKRKLIKRRHTILKKSQITGESFRGGFLPRRGGEGAGKEGCVFLEKSTASLSL